MLRFVKVPQLGFVAPWDANESARARQMHAPSEIIFRSSSGTNTDRSQSAKTATGSYIKQFQKRGSKILMKHFQTQSRAYNLFLHANKITTLIVLCTLWCCIYKMKINALIMDMDITIPGTSWGGHLLQPVIYLPPSDPPKTSPSSW